MIITDNQLFNNMQKGDNYQYFSLGIYLIPNYLLMCRRYFSQIQGEKKAVSSDTAFSELFKLKLI